VEFVEPDLPLGQRPDHYPPLDTSQLTNTILLNGPHGSGKSAAVHAAATELGWEVFEVYSGLGKRTAANLMSWVGDVGKNHLVVKGGKAEPPKEEIKTKTGLKSFFGHSVRKAAQEDDDPIALTGSQGSLGEPIEVDTSPKKEEHLVLDQAESRKAVRQSLIFIDEADLLFAEENTFWPAVISLVAESRRPVILACNGKSVSQLIGRGCSCQTPTGYLETLCLCRPSCISDHLLHISPFRISKLSRYTRIFGLPSWALASTEELLLCLRL